MRVIAFTLIRRYALAGYVSYYAGQSGHGIRAVAFAALASSARKTARLTLLPQGRRDK